ncbi:MAG: 7-cyano-7-deazaguanine synthase [Syntrophobacterales bacterium]|nr:7-cyano-7-deazaguanine synthase [Syntrophobacterales bacterium]
MSLHHNLACLPAVTGPRAGEVTAALLSAAGIWAADKILPRASAPDAWTREITMMLPATLAWGALSRPLAELLQFLTGDRWVVEFRDEKLPLALSGSLPESFTPEAVVLFSGGLDSLAGAIDLLSAGRRIWLVSHYDYGQLAQVQQVLAAALTAHFGADRLQHLAVRLQCPEAPELTLRSRAFLYLTLGLAAAAALGPGVPVVVPENGWIALNPPLTSNRLGSYSTRTAHPRFLAGLGALWHAAGLEHTPVNPYAGRTKGEVLARCREPDLLRRLAPLSVSCARPVAARWRGQGGGSCGYCYPCLLRRAALNRQGWDEAGHYLKDALADPEIFRGRVTGADLRALLLALKTWQTAPEVLLSRVIPPGGPEAGREETWEGLHRLVAAGFEELAALLEARGGPWLRQYLGAAPQG